MSKIGSLDGLQGCVDRSFIQIGCQIFPCQIRCYNPGRDGRVTLGMVVLTKVCQMITSVLLYAMIIPLLCPAISVGVAHVTDWCIRVLLCIMIVVVVIAIAYLYVVLLRCIVLLRTMWVRSKSQTPNVPQWNSFRGGGTPGTDASTAVAVVEANQECNVQHLESFVSLLSGIDIAGAIDGEEHTAAWTCGDGACALHALFGVPTSHQLEATNVRQRVLHALPAELPPLVASLNQELKNCLGELLEAVWAEAKAAATATYRGSAVETEQGIIWNALPEDLQLNILELVEAQRMETRQDKQLLGKNMQFAAQLFDPRKQDTIIRPLCVLLGYLQPDAPRRFKSKGTYVVTAAGFRGRQGQPGVTAPVQ